MKLLIIPLLLCFAIAASAQQTKATLIYTDTGAGWVYINREDSALIKPFIYDNGPDYVQEGLFRFVEHNRMGFANPQGEKIIPAMFDFVTPFKNGIAEYKLGGRLQKEPGGEHEVWTGSYYTGYLNKQGQLFKEVYPLKNNQRKALTLTGQWVLLNKKGKVISFHIIM